MESGDYESNADNEPSPGGYGGSAGGTSSDGGTLPPEKEVESSYEMPAATSKFVWVANPLSGRVAYIDATTLEVRTTEAGNGPTYLAPIPNQQDDTTIVINTLSSTATILRASATGDIDSKSLSIAGNANSWAIDGSGKWAIAWTDARKLEKTNTAQGFQDITVVRTTQNAEQAWRLSVGYRPVAINFSADSAKAFAVSQDGISVIDLSSTPTQASLIAISDDPLEDPGTRDVAITPSGDYAIVRRDNKSTVTLIRLSDGVRREVQLDDNVTDLDLSPDGSAAIAVVRNSSTISMLPIPAVFDDPTSTSSISVTDAIVGSVVIAGKANAALVYSNASNQERIAYYKFDSSPQTSTTLKLHAPVLAAFLAPNAASAIVLHAMTIGAADAGANDDVLGAFSVLSLNPILPAKITPTPAPPIAVSLKSDGKFAVVAEREDTRKIFGAYLVRTETQQVDRYQLASPPIAVGTLEGANRVYIAQKHAEGRVTFVQLDSGRAVTLTGFELGSRVVDGSK